jgi:histidyl-tRNA synthetase
MPYNRTMNTKSIFSLQGMNDVLPVATASSVSSFKWEQLEQKVREVMRTFSYKNIRTPLLEATALFVRGVGSTSDIVSKEMYTFPGSDGESFTLRPENTASVVRAAIQNNLLYDAPRRLYYMGPMFRRERPQRGRYRQFNQIGAEALGFSGSEVDVEMILLAVSIFSALGLTVNQDYRLEINSLGNDVERAAYRAALSEYLLTFQNDLKAEDRARVESNPLRLLDSKNICTQRVLSNGPKLTDYLGKSSKNQLRTIELALDEAAIPYSINPSLVRGLDYYSGVVFECVTERLGAQNAICGGGRYDGLFEEMGGPSTPAVGFAFGVERVLELLQIIGLEPSEPALDAYAITTDPKFLSRMASLLQSLRSKGCAIQMQSSQTDASGNSSMQSMKNQFKRANASGARFSIVLGESEFNSNTISVKNMLNGEQSVLPISDPSSIAAILLSK